MTSKHQCSVRSGLLMLVFALGLALRPELTLATDHEPWGSPGGNYFRDECPKGSYLVGVNGRYGGWVDRIATVCAPWLPAQKTFGAPTVGKSFGTSRGGAQKERLCWGFGLNNRAVQSWFVWRNRSDDKYVNAIQANCLSLAPPVAKGNWGFGSLPDLPRTQSPLGGYDFPIFLVRSDPQTCPPGELGVGIHGRAGLFVDALGLICGPLPVGIAPPATMVNPLATAPTTAATKVNPLSVVPVRDDMFTILKPANGDQVVQGQLALLVKPPKVGVPPVTVLEFKYLDAPPNNPYSYTIAVETPQLLQNYLVPQQSTPGYAGRWEVRARIAAQPTPGPWSLPAQFQLVVPQQTMSQKQVSPVPQTAPLPSSSVQQPSPIQQTSPLPSSSVMQAPAPSSSADTQMRRSPSMIMPRGVGEQPAPESNQTVDTSPKPEKKP